MRGSRTKDKLKAKVIEARINAPDSKLREISESTGIPTSTVAQIIDTDM